MLLVWISVLRLVLMSMLALLSPLVLASMLVLLTVSVMLSVSVKLLTPLVEVASTTPVGTVAVAVLLSVVEVVAGLTVPVTV